MAYFIPDLRAHEPGTMLPGRKPTRPVVVNRRLKYAPDLYCYLFQDDPLPVNLAGGSLLVAGDTKLSVDGTNALTPVISNGERMVDLANTAGDDTSSSVRLNLPDMPSFNNGYMLTRFVIDAAESGFCNIMSSIGPSNSDIYLFTEGLGFTLGFTTQGSDVNVTVGSSLNTGETLTVCLTWNGSAIQSYINGANGGTDTYTQTMGPATADSTHLGQIRDGAVNSNAMDGKFSLFAMGSTYLTGEQARRLTRDPFHIFQPADNYFQSISTAVASSSVPAYVHHLKQQMAG